MSSTPNVITVDSDSDKDIVTLNRSNQIKIHRSDGVKHDIVSVFAKSGINEVVDESIRLSENKPALVEKKPTTSKTISINRSDGLHHDINAVLRTFSDKDIFGSTKSIPPVTTPPATLKDSQPFSFKRLASRLSFNMLQKNPAVQRNSLTESLSQFHPSSVRIVHMSDTFNFLRPTNKQNFLPEGDILVHTGNFTLGGTDEEFALFDQWLSSVKNLYHYRVVCLGNKDVKRYGTEWDVFRQMLPNATHVLCHEEATILGIKFYSIPWYWGHTFNYSLKLTASSNNSNSNIPNDVHILISHGPSYGYLDRTIEGEQVGSRDLNDAIQRSKPLVHLHGHVTEARGFIPPFGRQPLTLNSCCCEKTRKVMYAIAQVIKGNMIKSDPGKNSSWEFYVDFL